MHMRARILEALNGQRNQEEYSMSDEVEEAQNIYEETIKRINRFIIKQAESFLR